VRIGVSGRITFFILISTSKRILYRKGSLLLLLQLTNPFIHFVLLAVTLCPRHISWLSSGGI